MSFNLILTTNTVYATNTAGKDYSWAFDSSVIEDGDYQLTFQFTSGNIALATFATNGPVQISVDTGSFGSNYVGGALVSSISSQIFGSLRLVWSSATIATYVANNTDNHPVYFKNVNKSSNFIRIHLDQAGGTLVGTGITPWVVVLNFQKL
jgi:hypothetical protein